MTRCDAGTIFWHAFRKSSFSTFKQVTLIDMILRFGIINLRIVSANRAHNRFDAKSLQLLICTYRTSTETPKFSYLSRCSMARGTIHQSQQSGHHAGVNEILPAGPYRREAVNFVKENNARFCLLCLEEENNYLFGSNFLFETARFKNGSRDQTLPTSEKIFSSFFSLSPTHLLRQSEPLREMKETLRSELLHSVANALATRVFPVPNEE
ncbi:hypothetical protein PUN28_003903 [Cardiocondyla obscurior]|uniref:Uncharacterized protein n=1 Tax=Cardiocondyla obscurior TaxID=286306 RepID=A0AAW2GM74_9HYME